MNSDNSKKSYYPKGAQRVFPGTASEAAFLLGGIGTGNLSIGARGELRDWEIFNTPGKGTSLHYSFFALWVKEEGKSSTSKVLESKLNPPFSKSHGFHSGELAGLPRFEKSELRGEYPIAWVTLTDDNMPVEVKLETFTPMIPLNPDDSGIPCAIFKYNIKNKTQSKIDVAIAASMLNPVGFCNYDKFDNLKKSCKYGHVNEYKIEKDFSGLHMYSSSYTKDDLKYGNVSVVTTSKNITYKTNWVNGGWWDGIHDMWDDFTSDGKLESIQFNDTQQNNNSSLTGNQIINYQENCPQIGSIGAYETLEVGENKDILFMITWHFPNRINGWNQPCCDDSCDCSSTNASTSTQNYYANLFTSSWDCAKYTLKNYNRLYKDTVKFHDALFNSSLPAYVIDAAASNMDIIRSTTCFRLNDGKFFGYEGCFDKAGCCEGNCTHVWNYEQTLAFLFPSLERDMRLTEFNIETADDGRMQFRTKKLFGESYNYHPAADGQLGCIIRLYRDWKLCGDNEFLASVWENVRKVLDFAFAYWDSDGDYVLDSQQHNTYDIEFYGPNSLVNSMFYGALKAGIEMATVMGDTNSKEKYCLAYALGSEKMDKMLWNGEYYIQVIDDVNKYKYQYGKGCLSDQLLGQMTSHVAGLGYILPEAHVKKAIKSIFKYNFLEDFSIHHNVQRTYVLNDEKGLVLCSWPNGGRPKIPFVYSDEVWTGIEYQVATHLIYEGFIDEGLSLVKAVRDRHDGFKRNPWNEVECGHHYARAMSSWAILIALSGFKYDLVEGVIEFNPVINQEDFSCFFSCGSAWGVFEQKMNHASGKMKYNIDVIYGSLAGITVKANNEIVCYC